MNPLRLLWLAPLLLLATVVPDVIGVLRGPSRTAALCPADALVVMGAAQYDGRPSPALQRRLDEAVTLYREGCAPRVIVSGGRQEGDRSSEGEAGVRYLALQGIPPEALLAETRAHTSMENLTFSRALLDSPDVVIVTDDLHAFRTAWIAKHLGLDARVAGVPVHHGRLPYAAREVFILTAYRLGVLR